MCHQFTVERKQIKNHPDAMKFLSKLTDKSNMRLRISHIVAW
uniref:Uncharacterized protein n=1 Tax=Rhizophora mucronata TaxID=61149 RepID=A0A2P2QHG2_RHIMU